MIMNVFFAQFVMLYKMGSLCGIGVAHGTFGELLQGEYNGSSFLVTLPIANKSTAVFIPDKIASEVRGDSVREKARRAVSMFLELHGIQCGGHLSIASNIPIGKGMASSSADIVASLRAVADVYRRPCSARLISQIACKIERTDGVMYDGVVLYNPKNGRLMKKMSVFPPIVLLGIDAGGQIDTAQFYQTCTGYRLSEQILMRQTLQYLLYGVQRQNTAMIFRSATISATINQRRLQNPYFYTINRLASEYGGGVVVAHSGTVIGLLLDPKRLHPDEVHHAAQELSQQTGQKLMIMQRLSW